MLKKLSLLVVVFTLMIAIAAPPAFAQDGEDGEEQPTITDVVVNAASAEEGAEFTVLLSAVQAAGFADALAETGPYTVFAPTDAAFTALLEELGLSAEELLADTELLTDVLSYHVVPGTFFAEDVAGLDGASVATLLPGGSVEISTADGVMVDNATVIQTDIEAANGVIHVIDTVIVPGEEDFPPMMEDEMGDDDMAEEDMEELPSIAGIVVDSTEAEEPQFTVLLAAVEAAGFTELLADESQTFTVFAPTDEAFMALLEALGTDAETLLSDTELLSQVLSYHVVPGTFYAEDIANLNDAFIGTALPGSALSISTEEGVVINSSNVISTDIEAANGIIHVIDAVLVPEVE
jgi:uncharacterized surface protein with fasciclin (FAS1) repeats